MRRFQFQAASRPRPRPPVWHEAGRQAGRQQQQQQIAFATSSSLIVASQQTDNVVGNMLPVAPQFAASANKFSFQLKKSCLNTSRVAAHCVVLLPLVVAPLTVARCCLCTIFRLLNLYALLLLLFLLQKLTCNLL